MTNKKIISHEDLGTMLKKYKEILVEEVELGANIGELTHLIGRIGELYVANKLEAQMAFTTNSPGYDVLKIDKSGNNVEKISVKTTSSNRGSHQFHFNKNTIDKVDRIILLKISIIEKVVCIEELMDKPLIDAKNLMVERNNYHISLSKTRNLDKYQNCSVEDDVLIEETIFELGHKLHFGNDEVLIYFADRNTNKVRLQINGEAYNKSVSSYLEKICITKKIATHAASNSKKIRTNWEMARDIINKL